MIHCFFHSLNADRSMPKVAGIGSQKGAKCHQELLVPSGSRRILASICTKIKIAIARLGAWVRSASEVSVL